MQKSIMQRNSNGCRDPPSNWDPPPPSCLRSIAVENRVVTVDVEFLMPNSGTSPRALFSLNPGREVPFNVKMKTDPHNQDEFSEKGFC
jgi:hypothetical protein